MNVKTWGDFSINFIFEYWHFISNNWENLDSLCCSLSEKVNIKLNEERYCFFGVPFGIT